MSLVLNGDVDVDALMMTMMMTMVVNLMMTMAVMMVLMTTTAMRISVTFENWFRQSLPSGRNPTETAMRNSIG